MKFLFIFFFLSFNLFAGEKVNFHKARTELEKFVEDGIKGNFDSRCLYIYNEYPDKEGGKILEKTPNKERVEECSKYITKDLMQRISRAERESCNKDKYGYDYGCFVEMDLIWCGQDILPGGLSFKTIKEIKNEIELLYVDNYRYMQGFQEEFDKCREEEGTMIKKIKHSANYNEVDKICIKKLLKFENKVDNFDLDLDNKDISFNKIYLKKENGVWKLDGSDCIDATNPHYGK